MKIGNDILNILDKCIVKNNTVFLPDEKLERKTYEAVNKCLESIGGSWNKKAKGHMFNDDPADMLDNIILTGETIDLKKEYQYFPTPSGIAKQMIEMADIENNHFVLEPEAGTGGIADYIPNKDNLMLVELNEQNCKILQEKGYKNICVGGNFLNYQSNVGYDRIVMNPPFSKQQDVDHILHAWDLLKSNGILVSVVSESPFFRTNKKSIEFREWLEDNNAEVIELDAGAFKESGTLVKTRLIKVCK